MLLQRPACLRLEVMGVLGQRVAALATDGSRYDLYRAERPGLESGEVHPGILYEVAGLALTPEEAVRLALGSPLAPGEAGSAAIGGSVLAEGVVRVELRAPPDGLRRTLEFGPGGELRRYAVHDTGRRARARRALRGLSRRRRHALRPRHRGRAPGGGEPRRDPVPVGRAEPGARRRAVPARAPERGGGGEGVATKRLLIAAPLVLVAFLLQSWLWVPSYEHQTRGNPGRVTKFIEGSIGDAHFLNPVLSDESTGSGIVSLVFDKLLDLDENLALRAKVAERWEVVERVLHRGASRGAAPGRRARERAAAPGADRGAPRQRRAGGPRASRRDAQRDAAPCSSPARGMRRRAPGPWRSACEFPSASPSSCPG